MKKAIVLFPFILSSCIIFKTPQPEPEQEEIVQSNTFQLNEDTGILCKNNRSIECNEIRDYCFNNTKDKDCQDFYQVAGKNHD